MTGKFRKQKKSGFRSKSRKPSNSFSEIRKNAKKQGFRSNLELRVAKILKGAGLPFSFEPGTVPYILECTYLKDFEVCGWVVETKGYWDANDRRKQREVRRQNPHLKIVMCFSDPSLKATPQKTYAEFCDWKGWEWCTPETLLEFLNAKKIR